MNSPLNNAMMRAQRHVQVVREDMDGQHVTIGGVTYQAAVTMGRTSQVFNDTAQGRFVQTGNVSIRKEILSTCPAIGAILTIQGLTYEVVTNGLPELQPWPSWQLTVQRWLT